MKTASTSERKKLLDYFERDRHKNDILLPLRYVLSDDKNLKRCQIYTDDEIAENPEAVVCVQKVVFFSSENSRFAKDSRAR